MKILLVGVLVGVGACGSAGDPGAIGEGGAPGATGATGATGLAGAPGAPGIAGTAAILLVTDEVSPPVIPSGHNGPSSPPFADCLSEEHTFTTTTGHVLIQRTDARSVSLDGLLLASDAPSPGEAHALLLATHVTANTPHTIAAFAGFQRIDDWRLGTCTTGELARNCQTMTGDVSQCWCPPSQCPTQGTIVVTELP